MEEPADCSLTETVLIQTGPLKMSAHLAVIDALMNLNIKETINLGNRKLSLVKSYEKHNTLKFFLAWLNQSCQTLRIRLEDEKEEKNSDLPKFEKVNELGDLRSGAYLAAACALYCPSNFPWTDIDFSNQKGTGSTTNIELLQRFQLDFPSYHFFHLTAEDILDMDASLQTNVECMLADMFNVFELYPIAVKNEVKKENNESFVVKRSKNIPTLDSVVAGHVDHESGVKERLNQDTKSEERGESTPTSSSGKPLHFYHQEPTTLAAGRPSDRTDSPQYKNRGRSRRNSTDDNQSQISLENIGGSMENLSVYKRNPDKDLKVHSGRRTEDEQPHVVAANKNANQQTFDIRRLDLDNLENEDNHLDNKRLDELEEMNRNSLKASETSSNSRRTSFADLRKNSRSNQFSGSGIQITFSQGMDNEDKPTVEAPVTIGKKPSDVDANANSVNSKLNSVRMKLEERRNRIESEKQKSDPNGYRQRLFAKRESPEKDYRRPLLDQQKQQQHQQQQQQHQHPQQQQPELQFPRDVNNMMSAASPDVTLSDHITELNSNIQRLALQQSQIEQMIRNSSVNYQTPPSPARDIYKDTSGSAQRRTWGQPQPIHFPSANHFTPTPYGMTTPVKPREPPPPQMEPVPNYLHDQWGNVIAYGGQIQAMAPHHPQEYISSPPPTLSHAQSLTRLTGLTTSPGYSGLGASPGLNGLTASPGMRNPYGSPSSVLSPPSSVPFRLHERYQNTYDPVEPKNDMPPTQSAVDTTQPAVVEEKLPRKFHAPVPAPAFDEMAPQNVSFIENTSDLEDSSPFSKNKENNLSDIDTEKSFDIEKPTPAIRSRSSISSSFKERRKGSNDSVMSLSQSERNSIVQVKMSEEEVETLNNMKTEVLKTTGDPSKGFVISFDDEPVKPKPVLKERKSSKNNRASSDPVMIMLDMNEELDSDEKQPDDIKPIKKNSKPSEKFESVLWDSYDTTSEYIPYKDKEERLNNKPKYDNTYGDSDESAAKPVGLVIEDANLGDSDKSDMARKKEKIILQSLKRKQEAEERRIKREFENRQKKEEAALKAEEAQRKKEEEARRKEAILEAHKLKKEMEKAEEEGRKFPSPVSAKPIPKIMNRRTPKSGKPKSTEEPDYPRSHRNKFGSSQNLTRASSKSSLLDSYGGRPTSSMSNMSLESLGRPGRMEEERSRYRVDGRTSRSNAGDYADDRYGRYKRDPSVNKDGMRGSRDSLVSRRTYTARRGSNASLYDDDDLYYGGSLRDLSYNSHRGARKSSSTSYLGPGSLPSKNRRGDFDDGASDVSSASGWSYGYRSGGGSRLGIYREPASKSNRPIVMNAIEHVVFPGVVNKETRFRVLEEIDACDCPHFLILFRDLKCQFRGLYAYYPDTEEVFKIYGTGPKQISEKMIDKFFKYNSGGKKFTQIHTKSLTVTIDAITIHNSIWLGKKGRLPDNRSRQLLV